MKHPTSEAWMAYLFNDDPDSPEITRAEAEAHLSTCVECRQQVEQWRATLGILNLDKVPESRQPINLAAILPARPATWRGGRAPWPWAVAAAVLLAAAFLAGRALGPTRAEFQEELARARVELTLEITSELRTAHQRDLADVAAATVKASTTAQRQLATSLLTGLNEARLADRREFLDAMERMDRRRSEEVNQLRDGFQALAEKTGGAFQETDTRLNALASALPGGNDGGAP